MSGDAPVSWLMFFTLAAGLVVAAGFFLNFLQQPTPWREMAARKASHHQALHLN